ncbi:MAG TPA: hypothetical protein VG474_15810, partial [Solirubrobacteraceae bacterium]|nr:hypothetical protein [Solirubrobacteraceae bacterium]
MLIVLFTVYVVVASIVSVSSGELSIPGLNTAVNRCDETGFACTVVSNIVFTFIPLALTFGLFLFGRLTRVRRRYVKEAQSRPSALVETAGSIVGTVVGRRDICDVIQDDLRGRDRRRPHVIVGGVGIGKTAVVVELTRLLAHRGAVPVPVRLRDATTELDFLALARRRFLQVAGERLLSEAEGERVWRQLRREDRIVVLADGLEEALLEADVQEARDHRIRVAVSQARSAQIPLVIASRPHDAVNALDAAVVRLEPLSTEAGREYIMKAGRGIADQRLNWIIATADVVETPLYLQITRDLHAQGLLDERLETRGVDRIELRSRLMKAWLDALVRGELQEDDPVVLDRRQREATAWHASGLACVALINDTLQVTFDEYLGHDEHKRIREAVEKKVRKLPTREQPLFIDAKIAASNGVRIGLLEQLHNGVRFPHSILQAYLGSRLIGEALLHEAYLRSGLENASRELLVALTMYSRDRDANQPYDGRLSGDRDERRVTRREWLRDRLADVAAHGRWDAEAPSEAPVLPHPKRLDLLCAAIEIDSVAGVHVDDERPALARLAEETVERWGEATEQDDATQDAKFKLVAALGESA